jgi:hypothetical protein
MKFNQFMAVLVSFLLVPAVFSTCSLPGKVKAETSQTTYFGVDIAFSDVLAIEQIIDKICNYTNLVVFGSTNTTYNDRT